MRTSSSPSTTGTGPGTTGPVYCPCEWIDCGDAGECDGPAENPEEREEAVDLWQFTNLIAENYSTGQKMVLAEIMWGLVYSDSVDSPPPQAVRNRARPAVAPQAARIQKRTTTLTSCQPWSRLRKMPP